MACGPKNQNIKQKQYCNKLNTNFKNAKSLQSCLTLCDPMDFSLSGFSVRGIPGQEYSSGLLGPPPGDLRDPGMEPTSLNVLLHWQAGSLPLVQKRST